ncbi:MAG: hypothetical protein PF450_03885, partial [Bacteroidales bacterium]|jgi:uncharacterized integral membrane protein|nr:hypothetical protein [Bacteroidales bacterium]
LNFKKITAFTTAPYTPSKMQWEWTLLASGILKLLLATMFIPILVVSFDEIAPWAIKLLFSLPSDMPLPIHINAFWALLIGLTIDFTIHKMADKLLKKKK